MKIKWILFFLCAHATFAFSEPLVELKTGYFFFSDSKMRKIFDRGGEDIQLAGSFCIYRNFQLYTSAGYISRHGRSLHGYQKTRLNMIPVSVGIKPVFCLNNQVDLYATIGPRYLYVHQHNDSSYVNKKITRNGIGMFLGTGLLLRPCDGFVVDVFAEYSYARLHYHSHRRNVEGHSAQFGGFTVGGGLGYSF